MFGAIIGDICGSVYEWHNQKDIDRVMLFKKGCFPTDDSVMTVAVAKALMDSAGMPEAQIRDALIDSMHYYGNLFPHAGYGGMFSEWLADYKRKPYKSWGNGSGMRVAAAGWMYRTMEKTLDMAEITAKVTHDHPEGIKGAQAIAACIFLARNGCAKDEIREFTEQNFYSLDFTIDEIRPDYGFEGSCQRSCPQAIEAFLESSSFDDSIKLAISLGGDSDTIACMTGAIAEAFYGIPEETGKMAWAVLTDRYDDYSVLSDEVLRFWSKGFGVMPEWIK